MPEHWPKNRQKPPFPGNILNFQIKHHKDKILYFCYDPNTERQSSLINRALIQLITPPVLTRRDWRVRLIRSTCIFYRRRCGHLVQIRRHLAPMRGHPVHLAVVERIFGAWIAADPLAANAMASEQE
jgi:hypothetical protein